MGYGYSPALAGWLKRNAEQYDAAILHGLWNYASVGGWRGLRGSRTPYFVFTHGMLDPWFRAAYPLKGLIKASLWRALEHRVLRDAAGVLYTTEEERRLAARSFSPYRAREFVVGHGARDVTGDPASFRRAFDDVMPRLKGRRFILFLSRVHPKKGLDLLIAGFATLATRHPDLDLVVAGPDTANLKAELTAQAERLGATSRIHWPGMLTGDAKWGALAAASFFALTSHQENFGIAVAEALAFGKPVLITNKVNIWREVEQDGAGIVVNDDLPGVTSGLQRMCAMTAPEQAAVSANARRCFLQRYDQERVAVGLLDVLRNGKAVPRPASP